MTYAAQTPGAGPIAKLALAAVLTLAPSAVPAQSDGLYRLGPGDELAISVYGEPALSGRYRVSADGSISYPLIGLMQVSASTVGDLTARLRAELVRQTPNGRTVTAEVATYAPVFVTGDVEKPGQHEFRPGMTVAELVAIAGGVRRAGPQASLLVQLITTEQQVKDLTLSRFAQKIQRARLRAEMASTDFSARSIAVDAGLSREAAQRIVEGEDTLFAARRRALDALLQALKAQQTAFGEEITTLERSIVLHDDEIRLLQQEVKTQDELVRRGIGIQPRLLALRREFSATLRISLDIRASLARARQKQLEVNQKIAETGAMRANENALALRELDLAAGRTELSLASMLAVFAELQARVGDQNQQAAVVSYSLVREESRKHATTAANEFSGLRPRDIVRVTIGLTGLTGLAEAPAAAISSN